MYNFLCANKTKPFTDAFFDPKQLVFISFFVFFLVSGEFYSMSDDWLVMKFNAIFFLAVNDIVLKKCYRLPEY